MRPLPPKLQATLTVALSLVAALTFTLLASGAFAHTGADGGGHHDRVNMARHLSDLDAWLAALTPGVWFMLPMLLALCVWRTVR
jgi:putative copper export protein